jgi:hypothetical protein
MSGGNFGPEKRANREPAGDLWRHTMARIPTLFGRLLYLASLRNQPEGIYEHAGLSKMVGAEEAEDTLRNSHARSFQDWLCLTLEQQKSDLQEYLAETPNPSQLLSDWSEPSTCALWVPATAQDAERRLFTGDLGTLISLLRREYGGASRVRES